MRYNMGVDMTSNIRAGFLKGIFFATSMLLAASPVSAAIIFQDNFDSGTISKKLPSGSAFWSDNSSTYQQPSATKLSTITVQPESSGGYSLRALYAGTPDLADDARPELRFALGGQYAELWISFRLYIPQNYYHRIPIGSGNNKFFIMDDNSGGQFVDFETWPRGDGTDEVGMQLKYNGVNHDFQKSSKVWILGAVEDRGKWHNYVLHYKLATSASANNGIVQVWKNDDLVMDFQNLPNYSPSYNYFERGYIFGASNSGFTNDTELRLDDITFATIPPLSWPHWMP